MRARITSVLLASLLAISLVPSQAGAKAPRVIRSVPGQLTILTINARQNAVLGIKRFEDMLELARAVRRRPLAWNGGYNGGVTAPDIVLIQEARPSNAEILEHILRQRFSIKYRLAGADDAASQTLYNPETVSLSAEPVAWADVCLGDSSAGARAGRFYQASRFIESASATPFTVAAIHMPKTFGEGAEHDCYARNMERVRQEVEGDPNPVFIAGDFNRRAVEIQHECDPQEFSPMFPWYSALVAPTDGGRVFEDAVKTYHRRHRRSMVNQWTHEQKTRTTTCDNSTHFRRTRIDYIFSSGATVAEATVDHPGWAGQEPGTKREGFHKYSDHRFVWGRFVLNAPPQVQRPDATEGKDGVINLTWTPVEGVASYSIYRSVGRRDYDRIAQVTSETTTFTDANTYHDVTYRYVVAPVAPSGAQGLESQRVFGTADSRGPKVVSVSPFPNAAGVARRTNIDVRFSERVDAASVSQDRIRVFRGRTRIPGTLRQVAPRLLVFDPDFPLRKKTTYTVKVKPVRDRLGNLGGGYGYKFTTGRI